MAGISVCRPDDAFVKHRRRLVIAGSVWYYDSVDTAFIRLTERWYAYFDRQLRFTPPSTTPIHSHTFPHFHTCMTRVHYLHTLSWPAVTHSLFLFPSVRLHKNSVHPLTVIDGKSTVRHLPPSEHVYAYDLSTTTAVDPNDVAATSGSVSTSRAILYHHKVPPSS